MSSNNAVNFKVFLRSEDSQEVRRFVVDDASVVTNFFFMKEKIQMVFPKLRDTVFRITWKDTDGDEITIDSDEDLITAFTEMSGPLKTLYISVLEGAFEQPPFQYSNPNAQSTNVGRVICDKCEKDITSGFRYKCLQCYDYDLCANCEHDGNHSEHMMLRLPFNEVPFSRCARRVMDHVNRSARKINHMAYREACRASKLKAKWEKQDEKRRCHEEQRKAEGSERNCPKPSACPMQGLNFENITPVIYPFLDALSNTVTATATATATAANAGKENANKDNPQPHFMDLIRNAINGFFDSAAQFQQEHPSQAPSQAENVSAAESSQASAHSQTSEQPQASGQNTPMEVEKETEEKHEQERSNGQPRENDWTIIYNKEKMPETSKPNAAVERENAKIAEGLKQLLDMGFSDDVNLVALLKRFDGNVADVVKHLFEMHL